MSHVGRPDYMDVGQGTSPPSCFDLVELKGDGHWGTVVAGGRSLTVLSRTGRPERVTTSLPVELAKMKLLGEHMFGTHWSGYGDRAGKVLVFDLVEHRGRDLRPLPLSERRRLLERLFRLHSERMAAAGLVLLEQYPAARWEALWAEHVQTPGLDGWEGLVFKSSASPYGQTWARMKRRRTMDYVVMHVNPGGEGTRYADVAGSVQGGLWVNGTLVSVCSVGGLNDDQRREFWEQRDVLPGRVFEAEGAALFPGGALRHPNFLRWRNDKPADECTWPRKETT